MESESCIYKDRFLGTFLIEAATPFKICSDDYSVIIDSPVLTDINGLPLIPGTSLAGVLRRTLSDYCKNDTDKEQNSVGDIFGYAEGDNGKGSRIMFSHAIIVDKDGSPVISIAENLNDFLNLFVSSSLPVRERNAVNGRGTTRKHSKFDEQIAPKGLRFAFEIEFKGNSGDHKDVKTWNDVLNLIKSDNFRLGGGTRHGFGLFKLINLRENIYKLNDQKELIEYLDRRFLSGAKELFDGYKNNLKNNNAISLAGDGGTIEYKLKLKPRDFFIFSSRFDSENTGADMSPLKEIAISYDEDKSDKIYYVLPASSIKGAISHRIAFHYNAIKKTFIDKIDKEKIELSVSPQNHACKLLFGSKKEKKGKEEDNYAGKTFFEDIFIEESKRKLVCLKHVSIDRFTGKSIGGALFSEEVLRISENDEINIRFIVKKEAFENDSDIKKALERTIFDIENGVLPLGGGVNRGHGAFQKV
jgi:CRISPR/Cas system CSM-associated protein Csm3 (group 7 of RAMP superfamily)